MASWIKINSMNGNTDQVVRQVHSTNTWSRPSNRIDGCMVAFSKSIYMEVKFYDRLP